MALVWIVVMVVSVYFKWTHVVLAMIALFALNIAWQLDRFKQGFIEYTHWVKADNDAAMAEYQNDAPSFQSAMTHSWHKNDDGSWTFFPVTKES
jgi:hypothetical protein